MSKRLRAVAAIGFSLVLIVMMTGAFAASPAAWVVPWWTVDGGGGSSTADSAKSGAGESTGQGGLLLRGTIGQADSGTMTGGPYVLSGGYWGRRPADRQYRLSLPVVIGEP